MKTNVMLSIIAWFILVTTEVYAQQNQKITLETFEKKLKQSSHPQILDARSPQEFSENHLIGAVHVNTGDVDAFKNTLATLKKQEPVFVYSINNGRSGAVARQLREQGFIEVYELPGGIAHWIGAGKPIETKADKGISTEEFEKAVASKDLVLVDVGSKYCGGCKKLAPVVESIGREQPDALNIVKIELCDNRALVGSLGIESVPTLILYKGNKPVWRKSGNITREDILEAIEHSL